MSDQTRVRPSRLMFYGRAGAAAVLAAFAFAALDRILGPTQSAATPATYLLLLGPALLFALAIEVLMSDGSRGAYTGREIAFDTGAATIAVVVILVAAVRIGEPVLLNPAPWLFMAILVVPFSLGIGYLRSLRASSVPDR